MPSRRPRSASPKPARQVPGADGPRLTRELHQLLELGQEPRVDARHPMDVLEAPALLEGAEHGPHPAVGRDGERLLQRGGVLADRVLLVEQRAGLLAVLEGAERLEEGFLERPADRHRLADRLHLRRQRAVGLRELLEGPARHLHDHVVDRRLEGGGRRARDVVLDFVEPVAEGEFRGDLRDREAGGLRGQRRRA
jgi:hypothetical protein